MKTTRVLLLLLLGVALFGCEKNNFDNSKVLATVNGEPITENDYDDYLKVRQTQQAPIQDKTKEKEVVLGEMINRVLLAQYALDNKLDRDPDVYLQLKRQQQNILTRAAIRKYLQDHPVTDQEVEKRYQQEVAKISKTEYKARHILLKSEEDAKDIITKLQHGANFSALAKAKSIDLESSKDGGNLGWFNQGEMIPEFFNAVAAMKPGEISKVPVKTEYGWHVIKLEDTRPLKNITFDKVKGGIRNALQEERIEDMVKNFRGKAKIN